MEAMPKCQKARALSTGGLLSQLAVKAMSGQVQSARVCLYIAQSPHALLVSLQSSQPRGTS